MYYIIIHKSQAIKVLAVDLINGEVFVEFKNGYMCSYSNVSRLAILNLMLHSVEMSLGRWVNTNCVHNKRAELFAYTY
jgi:hypothetical protein